MFNGSDALFMFGDTFLVVNLIVVPAGKLQRQSLILNFHRTWEVQAKGVIKFVHMNADENPEGILTNSRASNTQFPIIKPLFLWHDVYFLRKLVFVGGGWLITGRQHPLFIKLKSLLSNRLNLTCGKF